MLMRTFAQPFDCRKPDSLLALAWTTARLRGENDAEWYEALMRKLPPNIEVRPWYGFI